jgi:hypothetical protein
VNSIRSNKVRPSVLIGIALALLCSLSGRPSRAQSPSPVPLINQPLVPDATAPGGPQFTLTVNGTGFVSNSTVDWNGSPLATTFVSGSQLTAVVPAANVATAGTAWVTVVNPAPGRGTSNAVFFTATSNSGSYVALNPPSSFSTAPWGTASLAVGDFNGDGKPDLAVADGAGVSVYLGDGAGDFTLASTLSSWCTSSVAVGDFNGDGKPDIAASQVCTNPGVVLVYLGDGTGNFTLASSSTVGWPDGSLAVGDFNGDGKLDIAVANAGDNNVSILLGDGTGNFTLASSPVVGSSPDSIAVGDFNGDGKLDLAVANQGDGTVSILLGDGTGNFTQTATLPTCGGCDPASVAVGDFNGDAKLDLAVAIPDAVSIYIFLGDGTGNFTPGATLYTPNNNPVSLKVGDFNGDGILDLAVANFFPYWPYAGSVSVMLGDGTGNFTGVAMPGMGPGIGPSSVAIGDFTGNGRLDIAFTGSVNNTVSILLQIPPAPAVSLYPTSLNFGTQLLGTTSYSQSVYLLNSGQATLDITGIATSANFSQTNNCGTSVAVGGSCFITVTFQPRALGTLTGAVTITDNASNSPQTVSLTGIATEVDLIPTKLGFGGQAVGTNSPTQSVNVWNHASRTLSIFHIGIRGSDPADFAQTNECGTSVPPWVACTITVTFTPQAKGQRTATIEIVDNGGASPQTVSLQGYGK